MFMTDYLGNEWGPSVKLAHIELTKADVICRDFAMEAVKLMGNLSLPEVGYVSKNSYLIPNHLEEKKSCAG